VYYYYYYYYDKLTGVWRSLALDRGYAAAVLCPRWRASAVALGVRESWATGRLDVMSTVYEPDSTTGLAEDGQQRRPVQT